tara:strand:+ start:3090 stop:3749 length:660 start_codon:yes stop_codon:yes gene_type:complete
VFEHKNPYPDFINENSTKLIVGTLPPPRFTTGELKEGDVDFCYGSRNGQLWPILNCLFKLNLKFETTTEAIEQRKQFLVNRGLGIINFVNSAKREKIDASDLGMKDVELCDMVAILQKYPKVDTLLFMGGNSKNGPEYFFRRHLKRYNLSLEVISNEVPRIHTFQLPKSSRNIRTVSLTAPSGAANRAVGSLDAYRKMKAEFPKKTTIDFRVEQYKPFF